MKKLISALATTLILLVLATGLSAQTGKLAGVRFYDVSTDCYTNTLRVKIQATSEQATAFQTASWTFRFTFNRNMLQNPRKVTPVPVSLDGNHTLTQQYSPTDNDTIVSYGIVSLFPVATLQPGVWTTMAELEFDIISYNAGAVANCINFVWQEDTDVVPTVGQEYISLFSQPSLNIVTYGNEFTCISPNCAPIAVNDINATFVGIPVSGDVSTNDYDPNGDPLTFTLLTPPSAGTLTSFNPDGSYVFNPPTTPGEVTFTYVACDNGTPALCDTADVVIQVLNLPDDTKNEPPTANDDYNITLMDTPIDGNVLNNDQDIDGDNIVLNTTPIDQPNHGTVTISPNGDYTYTPATGYLGQDTFVYSICDDGFPVLCDTATVVILVLPDNGDNYPPFAGDDFGIGEINEPITLNILPNDGDPNGDPITVNTTPIDQPNHGTVTILPNGDIIYTPFGGYFGPDEFVYEICDNGTPALCAQATVYLLVAPANQPPVAINDINATLVNTQVFINVLTNDFDPDGDPITVNPLLVSGPVNGSLINGTINGQYMYMPNTDYVGQDSFVYVICDNAAIALCDTATVYITIVDLPTSNNNPPIANNDAFVTVLNTGFNSTVINNDSDPDGDAIAVTTTLLGLPLNGTVTNLTSAGTFTYTPDNGFTGSDQFTYILCDNGSPVLCDTALVEVIILPGDVDNNPPFAADDFGTGEINTNIVGNVLPNDYDVDGDPITLNTTPIEAPFNGTVVVLPNGTYTYTPNTGYIGPDQFVYEICDNGTPALCAQATVYLLVFPNNQPPVAVNDINATYVDVPVGGNVITNDYDLDGGTLTANTTPIVLPMTGANVIINANGDYSYQPAAGFVGTDEFQYAICDNGVPSLCDTATVFITIIAEPGSGNNPPVAHNDYNVTLVNTPVSANALNNDADPDGDAITATTTLIVGPAHGTATITAPGVYTYTPSTGYEGMDQFTYRICDNGTPVLCDTAIVFIEITTSGSGNNPPFAGDDFEITEMNTPVTGNVLPNDGDPDGNAINVVTLPIENPANGTVVISANGNFTYTPNTGFTGPDQFVYEICDNGVPSLCAEATVYILVNPATQICVSPKVFLQGSYNSTADSLRMYNRIRVCPSAGGTTVIPNAQPFNVAPYNYAGTETLTSQRTDMVDWVLVELRSSSCDGDVVLKAPGILTRSGNIYNTSGDTVFCLPYVPGDTIWVAIHHRNHLAALYPVGFTNPAAVNVADFRRTNGYQLGSGATATLGQRQIGTNGGTVYGLAAGNAVQFNGGTAIGHQYDINAIDLIPLSQQFSLFAAYMLGDYNMDCDCNAADTGVFAPNFNQFSAADGCN